MLKLILISELLGCELSSIMAADISITGISIDSRNIQPGQLFCALHGDRFDGHAFIAEAVARGASAVLCENPLFLKGALAVPMLMVPSTLTALTSIAKYYRQLITCPIIALTGSNGKTTVKEMIAAMLPQPAYATPGNFNNHIGVPLSIMQLNSEHRYAVFELGANHAGEIDHTAAMLCPQITLINNIAPAHIAGFGTIDGVARAKGEIHAHLCVAGTAIINDDDAYAHFWDQVLLQRSVKVIRFSRMHVADIYAKSIQYDSNFGAKFTLISPKNEFEIKLQLPGEHTISNALAAISCCYALDIPIENIIAGLVGFRGVNGRMQFLSGANDATIIDDTYNANLYSVLAAIAVLVKRAGRRILVLGDLGELGVFTAEHHEIIGKQARIQGVDMLLTCGKYSEHSAKAFGKHAQHYLTKEELLPNLRNYLSQDTTILVKGSRSAAMEGIVHQILSLKVEV